MSPTVERVVDLLPPTWQHWIALSFVTLMLLGLLVERMWLLRELRRDVAEIKRDLPKMKEDIETAQKTADDARSHSEMTAAAVEQSMQVIDRLHEAVLDLPKVLIAALRPADGR